jgi:hypothetical protein
LQVEPVPALPEAPEPVVKEPPMPLAEKPREPVVVKESLKLRRLATAGKVEMPPAAKPRPVEKTDRPAPPPGQVQTWWRLRPVQLNAGRVEVSVPYHIGIVVALVVTLVVLAAFRIGQKYPGTKARTPARAAPQNAATETTPAKSSQDAAQETASPAGEAATPRTDNWIVLAKHKNRADLDEVVKYFDKNGIKLEIRELEATRQLFVERGLNAGVLPSGDGYLLVTVNLYSNPKSPGTDGSKMLQRIVEVGATYKAPKGRETFAPLLFKDAYGMKISKVKQQEK